MKHFLLSRWFLILLVAMLALGIWQWEFLLPFSRLKSLRFAIVASVLFLMALPLEASVIRRTFQRPLAPALGLVSALSSQSVRYCGVQPALSLAQPVSCRACRNSWRSKGCWWVSAFQSAGAIDAMESRILRVGKGNAVE